MMLWYGLSAFGVMELEYGLLMSIVYPWLAKCFSMMAMVLRFGLLSSSLYPMHMSMLAISSGNEWQSMSRVLSSIALDSLSWYWCQWVRSDCAVSVSSIRVDPECDFV